jgi:NodT family efflux transporter outer membrane factor (OMF) lipoprotein
MRIAMDRRFTFASVACAASLVAASCALKTPPDTDAIKKEGMPKVEVPVAWKAVPPVAGIVTDNWLATFHDDPLTAAVVEAIASNPDLQSGAARVQQAELYAKLAGAKLYPSVDLLAHGGLKASDNGGLQGGWLMLSWELDVWGRVRYGRAAAAADAQSAQADYEFARQSMAAMVAKSWFLATEATLQADLARRTIEESQRLVRLAESRVQVGAGNDEDVYVARASVGTYQDALRQIELSRDNAIRALELLLGHYPAAITAIDNTLPAQPPPVPAGLPSELLERRPDVIAAERRVAAAFNRVGEAKAARLPAISLTTSLSAISSDLIVLKDHDNPVWSLAGNLLMPIYKGGALKTNVEIKTATQKEAVANYASIGLRAFGEVESALAGELAAHDREQILTQTLADNQKAYDVVQTQFRVGSTDMRFVTQRQLALNATQSALIHMQAEQRVQRVNLHLALGGSFEPKPAPPTPPPAAPKRP